MTAAAAPALTELRPSTAGAPPVRPVADQIAAAVTAAAGWSAQTRTAVLADLDAGITTLTAARADLLVAERTADSWRGSGDPSFEAWRGRTSRSGLRAASAEVRRAETLAQMPPLRSAARSGEVTLEHVDVVARTVAGASPRVREALGSPEGQREVLELARGVDAGRFAKTVGAWAATIDHEALESAHQAQRAERFLALVDTPRGTRLSGLVDAMAGHRLRLALEAVAGKPSPDDHRTADQRRADALDAIAGAALAAPPPNEGNPGRRPHVSMVLTTETWAALRARAVSAGTPKHDRVPPVAPVAPVMLEDGSPVPDSEVARALCDCELTRVVVDQRSEPVDLGRTTRMYTPGQRRAVTARDGGCLWPECGSPARWCQVHHLVWWDRDDGRTAVLDGALACSFHHHEIHRLDLTITRYALPKSAAPPGGTTTRYVITRADGTVVADGRPSRDGTPVGTALRRWVPGVGVAPTPAPPGPPQEANAGEKRHHG